MLRASSRFRFVFVLVYCLLYFNRRCGRTGCVDLNKFEQAIRLASTWLTSKEVSRGSVGDAIGELMTQFKTEPTGKQISQNICNMYAADLVVNFDAKTLVQEHQKFHKFITGTLNVTKKELGKVLMDRLDKLVKECKEKDSGAEHRPIRFVPRFIIPPTFRLIKKKTWKKCCWYGKFIRRSF